MWPQPWEKKGSKLAAPGTGAETKDRVENYTDPVYRWHNEAMPHIDYPNVIAENAEQLHQLEKRHRYTHLFQRVRML